MSISPDQRSAIDARSELDGWSYYSETLVNLGAISIALWKTASDPRTGNLSVSVTRDVLQLQFDSEKRTFQLPVAVEQSYSAIVGGDHFSVRLAIKSDDLEALQRPDENPCPISTVQLSTGEWFLHCAGCGSLLVRKSEVREWLDLPSAHWAEMMDFWHCHKPREGENEEDTSSKSRGYEMAANLYPQKGRALVDVTVIYLDQNYCCGLKIEPGTLIVTCASCMNIVGRTGLTGKDECFVILEKHALEMDRTMREQSISALAGNVQARDSIIVSYVSALLLSQFQSASIRSFYLSVQAPKQRGTLLLRIFATDTYYTSSDTHVSCAEDNPLLNGSSRALKVLYIDNLPSKVYEGAIKDAEELLVSEAAYLAVERILLRSSNTLPPQGRTLQMLGKQWSLGLLPRFRAEQAST